MRRSDCLNVRPKTKLIMSKSIFFAPLRPWRRLLKWSGAAKYPSVLQTFYFFCVVVLFRQRHSIKYLNTLYMETIDTNIIPKTCRTFLTSIERLWANCRDNDTEVYYHQEGEGTYYYKEKFNKVLPYTKV